MDLSQWSLGLEVAATTEVSYTTTVTERIQLRLEPMVPGRIAPGARLAWTGTICSSGGMGVQRKAGVSVNY